MLAVLYLISHLDRANIGNAKIEGLLEDLNMDGLHYNIALAIFFIPYILLGMLSPFFFHRTRKIIDKCRGAE